MAFIFSVHIPIAGMSLIPVLLKWPLALLHVHILFLELIIDPACTVVFEREADEKDVMKRPPRHLGEPLFSRSRVLTSLIQGGGVLMVVLAAYAFTLNQGYGEGEARMVGFACLVIANLGLVFSNCSGAQSVRALIRIPNAELWWVTAGAIGFLVLVLSIPVLRSLFRFAPVHSWEIALIGVAALISLVISELSKMKTGRKKN